LYFYYADSTEVRNPSSASCDDDDSYYIPSSGNFSGAIRGLSLKRYSGSHWHMSGLNWAFMIDANPCSLTQIIDFSNIPTMVITISGGTTSVDLATYGKNSYANSVNDAGACGSGYEYSIDPAKSFLSFGVSNPATLNG
jgi:hypothetical protein